MKVLVVSKQLKLKGGADLVTAAIIEALLNLDLEVTLLCYEHDEVCRIKDQWGIELNRSNFTLRLVKNSFVKTIRRSGYLSSLFLMRQARKSQFKDHILFGTWDEMDFGRKSIQYIHWVAHHPASKPLLLLARRPELLLNGSQLTDDSFAEKLSHQYRMLVSRVFNFKQDNVRNNISIFNCDFTKRQFDRFYGETAGHIVHPPLLIDESKRKDFSERENGFVYSGRISPDKNVHRIIEFIREIRELDSEIHLHIVGPFVSEQYRAELARRFPYGWVRYEGSKNRTQLSEILGCHKYAIQARYVEPFGMAAAEACKMGCLTFVPTRSGVAEFIAHDSLKFFDFFDLHQKFRRLSDEPQSQGEISRELISQFSQFTPEGFEKRIQSIFSRAVEEFEAN